MNKTVNINLGGTFFHIDEDAYQKLNRYFEAVKRSFTGDSGQDEIMADIEARVSEIFSERLFSKNHVVVLQDVDAMIAIMGQPEDYQLEEDNTHSKSYQTSTSFKGKKLFRDMDNKILGGVCAGFAHYLGIDSLWIRLLIVIITIIFGGVPILAYILFWVLVPKAITTAEKLAMTGEPANLFNIEKKVREEMDNPDYDKKKIENEERLNYTNNERSLESSLGTAITLLFTVFGKIIGVIILMISMPMLFSLLVGVIATFFGFATFGGYPAWDYVQAVMYDGFPLWLVSVLAFFALGIPFFYFMILGLKLLFTNMKSLGNAFNYTLLALWIFSLITLVVFGAKQGKEYAYDSKVVEKIELKDIVNDTLKISFTNNDFYQKNLIRNTDFKIKESESGKAIIYSNNIKLVVMTSKEDFNYIVIEKEADGSSLENSKKRAEKISYNLKVDNNKIILDNFLTSELKARYRSQNVKIYLYLKPNTIFKADQSIRNYEIENRLHGLWQDEMEQTYKMTSSEIECLTCKKEANWDIDDTVIETYEDDSSDTINTISVKVNGKEVINAEPKKGRLVIDKDGIVKKL